MEELEQTYTIQVCYSGKAVLQGETAWKKVKGYYLFDITTSPAALENIVEHNVAEMDPSDMVDWVFDGEEQEHGGRDLANFIGGSPTWRDITER
jgi:hypothetical protein